MVTYYEVGQFLGFVLIIAGYLKVRSFLKSGNSKKENRPNRLLK